MQDREKSKERLHLELNELRRRVAELEQDGNAGARARSALEDEVIRRRTLMDQSRDGIVILDQNGRVYEANRAFAQMLGYSKDEVLELSVWDWNAQMTRGKLEEVIRRIDASADHFVTRHRRKDGSIYDAEITTTVAVWENQKLIYCVCRDISERLRVEAALWESEHRYRELFEAGSDAILFIDNDTELILDANGAASAMFGYSREELLAKRNWELSEEPEETRQRTQGAKEALGRVLTVPLRYLRRKDGSVFPTEITARSFVWQGRPVFIAAIRDITERKRVEDAIRESELRFRTIYDSVDVGIAQISRNFTFESANHAYCRMVGYEEEELIGKHLSKITHPEILEENLEQQAKLVRGEINHYEMEKRFIHKNGHIVHGIMKANLVRNAAGDPSCTIGTVLDITERKQTEEALSESEQHFRTLVENAPDAIFIHVGGRFAYVNNAAVDLFGAASKDQLIGANVIERLHPDCREIVRKRMRALTQEFTPVPKFEHQYLRFDGSTVDVQASGVPFRYTGKDGALVFVRNITGQRIAEDALFASETRYKELFQQFKTVLEAIPDRLSFITKDFETLWANRMATQSMVAEDRSYTGDYCYRLWHMQGQPCENCSLPAVIKTGEPLTKVISEHDGKIWEYRFIPIKNEVGMVSNIVRLGRDITEHRSLEARLRQAQKFEAIGTLAGGIAHDFNNILAPIIGYTEMLLGDLPPSAPMRSDLEQVLRAAHRARELVRQILAFSRHGQDQKRMPVDVSSIVKEALKLMRASLPISVEIQEIIERGVVLADPTQIHQALVNLCTNASHAMEEKGVLGVSLSNVNISEVDLTRLSTTDLKPGNYVKLSVSDTGHGMDEKTMQRIFDPYFTTKGVGRGTGLGLAVVHGIVKRHEGSIVVQSEPANGTTFDIYFPRIEPTSVDPDRRAHELPRGTERVLIVDDERMVADLGSRMLMQLGYKVMSKTQPQDALDTVRMGPHAFDLVITDFTMPSMTGTELASEILKIRPDMPIILCTGYSEKASETSARELGIRGYALKPLDRGQLAELVRGVLDGQKL